MKPSVMACLIVTTCAPLADAQDGCEPQRVLAPAAVPTSGFGLETATSGEFWFVADPNARTLCGGSAFECATGAVFVYREVDGALELAQTLVPPDVSLYDFFGTSMSVDDDRLLVGGMGAEWPGVGIRQGVAYIYELEDGQWIERGRLRPPVEVTELFAANVYLSGDVALATSSRPERAVYRYELVDGAWLLRERVHPPEPLAWGDCFACTGAALGEWFFLAAYRERTPSGGEGTVYAYRKRADNTLELVQKITSEFTAGFGHGIDFDGQTLAIGAMFTDRDVEFQGVVHTYTFDGTRWVFEQEMTHNAPLRTSLLGISVGVQGDVLLAAETATRTASVDGRVIRFERQRGHGWQEVGALVPNPPVFAGRYGSALAMGDGKVLAGAPEEIDASGSFVGAAYFFDLSCGACPPDLDLDGALTIFDFLLFSNLFQDGDAQADFDGDGELTVLDFLAFQTAFDAGC